MATTEKTRWPGGYISGDRVSKHGRKGVVALDSQIKVKPKGDSLVPVIFNGSPDLISWTPFWKLCLD